MTWTFRIAPKNALIIELKADQDGAQWCFYMTTDSPNEAKRICAVLQGDTQLVLFEVMT